MSGHGPLVRPGRRDTLALIAKILRNNKKSDSLLFDTIVSIINNTLFANDCYDKAWQEIESVMEITGYVFFVIIFPENTMNGHEFYIPIDGATTLVALPLNWSSQYFDLADSFILLPSLPIFCCARLGTGSSTCGITADDAIPDENRLSRLFGSAMPPRLFSLATAHVVPVTPSVSSVQKQRCQHWSGPNSKYTVLEGWWPLMLRQ